MSVRTTAHAKASTCRAHQNSLHPYNRICMQVIVRFTLGIKLAPPSLVGLLPQAECLQQAELSSARVELLHQDGDSSAAECSPSTGRSFFFRRIVLSCRHGFFRRHCLLLGRRGFIGEPSHTSPGGAFLGKRSLFFIRSLLLFIMRGIFMPVQIPQFAGPWPLLRNRMLFMSAGPASSPVCQLAAKAAMLFHHAWHPRVSQIPPHSESMTLTSYHLHAYAHPRLELCPSLSSCGGKSPRCSFIMSLRFRRAITLFRNLCYSCRLELCPVCQLAALMAMPSPASCHMSQGGMNPGS